MAIPGNKINPARLRAYRKALGFSREQLAVQISRSFESIRLMETGAMNPSDETLARLCTTFACSPEHLLDEEDR